MGLVIIASLCYAAILNGWARSATQLLIKVQLPDGSPAKGVKIQLLQLERTFPRNFVCGMTDNDGEFNIRFEPEVSKDDEHYGWGVYRFVLMPKDLRWELSDIYYWNNYPGNELETGIGPEGGYRDIFREKKQIGLLGT